MNRQLYFCKYNETLVNMFGSKDMPVFYFTNAISMSVQ